MPKSFEYVPTGEYRPVMQRFCSCMKKVAEAIKEIELEDGNEPQIKFSWGFVGSANRYGEVFITREVGGNKGFDLDINIYLNRTQEDIEWYPDYVRNVFYRAIDKVFFPMGYKHPEDRTSVIRVKFLYKKNKTIEHSCDFAIFQQISDKNGNLVEKYARKNDNGTYCWSIRGGKNDEATEKFEWLNDNVGDNAGLDEEPVDDDYESTDGEYPYYYAEGCSLLSDLSSEYLKLKNNNGDPEKCSFQLFNEAINNIYNQWKQYIEKDC